MELAAQKATELGASAICPFISQNSVKRPKDPKKARDRLVKICEGAVKQWRTLFGAGGFGTACF